ncbi:MAG: N-acetylglucosamine-6-phosphate deacetylase [Pseudomonadota bacterium]|nr:N-acetylglucosamine-6-phosphate deacetylase [Pseudomonadota bacterium]
MIQAFASKYIFDGVSLLENAMVIVESDDNHANSGGCNYGHDYAGSVCVIKDVVAANSSTKDVYNGIPVTNFGDGVITPGFIDLQVNGCGGVLFNDNIAHDTLETIYQTWLKFGTTSFMPTLITCDFEDVIKALEVVRSWFGKFGNNRGVIGVHLEGPFISKTKRGIHPEQFIIPPTMDLLEQIAAYAKLFPIKMTVATEQFTLEQIKFLVDEQIIVSVGHSNAAYENVLQGIKTGITTATHVFNAMSGLTGRHPGVIGAVLNTDIYAGVIADGLHVDNANIAILNKIKPRQTYLITDAVTPTGTNLSQFELCGQTLYVKDGKCLNEDGVLGGAYLTMNGAVKHCVQNCGVDLANALAMASTIPASVMKLDDVLGKIRPGYRADLVYLDLNDFKCKLCMQQ